VHATQITDGKDWGHNEGDDKHRERDIVIKGPGEMRYERNDN
jgi:hypothetical protein